MRLCLQQVQVQVHVSEVRKGSDGPLTAHGRVDGPGRPVRRGPWTPDGCGRIRPTVTYYLRAVKIYQFV
eukprot:4130531-Prymnesium_polylepis.1